MCSSVDIALLLARVGKQIEPAPSDEGDRARSGLRQGTVTDICTTVERVITGAARPLQSIPLKTMFPHV